jgi:outer membrane receptor protein involved in Fe transport
VPDDIMNCTAIFIFALAMLFSAECCFATIFGAVRGIVHDPSHRPIQGAEASLRALASDWSQTSRTDSAGEFAFPTVPVGEYRVTVTCEGFAPMQQRVVVTSGSAPVLHFQLKIAVIQQVTEVSEQAELIHPESSGTTTLVTREDIRIAPGADRTNSLAMITNYVPGAYVTHDLLHVRGGHQATWAVDGIPVPNTNTGQNVAPQFDPKDIDYLEVQRGGYSSEYGDRTYAVFNVVPRTGFERHREVEIVSSYGQFHQTNDQISLGSHTRRFAYYASVNGNRTDLGLLNPSPAVIHDRANGCGAFASLVFNSTAANQFRLVTALRRDFYQVPNDADAQADGVRDVERESDALAHFSWVHTAGHGLLLTVSPFYHFNRANFLGGPGDAPVIPQHNHASAYAGAQVTLSALWNAHNARAGFYGFGQEDNTLFGLRTAPAARRPLVQGAASDPPAVPHMKVGGEVMRSLEQRVIQAGILSAAFIEDQYKIAPWLTLNGGVRLTRFTGSFTETAVSPRAGGAIRIPRLRWLLRGFYGRYYQPPPLATVSGPLLDLAIDQGFIFLPVHGERDEERQFGLTIPLRGWTFDLDNFHNRVRNFADHNVLGNSNIFFPVTVEGARIRAWEVTVQSPRLFHATRVHLAYSNQHVEGQGAISGGLTDFSPPPEGRFPLDHDQRHTLSTGLQANLPWRTWASANIAYGSGFPIENTPAHLPGRTIADVSLGKSLGESWSFSISATNVGNRRVLLDQSQTFGGTHFVDPRQIFAQVRYRFHY